jgi:predicted Zn-dependent protease
MGWMRAGHIASYGREQERSADHGGQTIAAKAGYDPMGMADFLRDLDAMDRLTVGWSRLPNFLASHPTTPERAATATHLAESIEWTPKPGVASSQEDFLRRFEGLVIGPNPAEGIFRDTRFLHPDLDFTLRFPDGWTLINTQRAVVAIAPGGKAMVALSVAGEGDDAVATAHRIREDELEPGGARIVRMDSIRLGSIEAYRLEAEGTIDGMRSAGHITFVAHRGLVFRIDALSGIRSASKYTGRGNSVARSFRPLTEDERESIEVMRLSIVRSGTGEDLAALSQRTGNALAIGNTGILNDVHFGDQLEDGRLVKIGVMERYEVREREPERSDVKAEDEE